jgi:hypothetical protein
MDPFDKTFPETKRKEGRIKQWFRIKLPPKMPATIWQGKFLPAFWSVGSALSVLLNIILLVVVIVLANQLFTVKRMLTNDVIGGLYYNFLLMDQANITTSVQVEESIPVQFELPLKQNTTVVLTKDTPIYNATVSMRTGGLNIQQAPTDIVLPKGTELPVELDLLIPVDTWIPIRLTVPVDIPLSQTELHQPFVGLQDVVSPFYWMLVNQPNSWAQARCVYLGWGCP